MHRSPLTERDHQECEWKPANPVPPLQSLLKSDPNAESIKRTKLLDIDWPSHGNRGRSGRGYNSTLANAQVRIGSKVAGRSNQQSHRGRRGRGYNSALANAQVLMAAR